MGRKVTHDRVGRPVNHPKILVVETGEVYDSYEDVAKAIGGRRSGVHACLRGTGNRSSHMGYHFRFVSRDWMKK